MKYGLFCIPALVLLTSYQPGTSDCRTVKRGVYEVRFRSAEEQRLMTYRLVRNDSFQEETHVETGHKTKLRVFWESPCTYLLRYHSGYRYDPDSIINLRTVLKIEILDVTQDYYVFKNSSNTHWYSYTDTAWRISR